MTLATVEFTLPIHWAPAMLHGDDDSLSAIDLAQMESFEKANGLSRFSCVQVDDHQDGGDFMKYHDAQPFGVLSCNVCTFHFDAPESDDV